MMIPPGVIQIGGLDFGAVASTLATVAVVSPILLYAMDERNRKKFASRNSVCDANGDPRFLTREDASGLVKRIEEQISTVDRTIQQTSQFVFSHNDRIADLEQARARLEAANTAQSQQTATQMQQIAETLRGVTKEVQAIVRDQRDLAIELAHIRGGVGKYSQRKD